MSNVGLESLGFHHTQRELYRSSRSLLPLGYDDELMCRVVGCSEALDAHEEHSGSN